MTAAAPYAGLGPEQVLDAIAACNLVPDGRLLALNSYENRVWQAGLEDAGSVVAKFYRPGRWSDAAIEEEHHYSQQLATAELPVVAPLQFDERSLFRQHDFRYSLTPRRGGRAPSLESSHELEWMGRLIARMHSVSAREPFRHRGRIDTATLIAAPSQAVKTSSLLPAPLRAAYQATVDQLSQAVQTRLAAIGPYRELRLHGDCHPGNILWTDQGPHFVDFDDARMGPAIQDLWMLAADQAALNLLIEAYGQFRDLDPSELALIPVLRAMRQVHYAGWIAARWHDPAFPLAFPFVQEARWWEQHIEDLAELTQTM